MAKTYDPATDEGRVRLLCNDNRIDEPEKVIFDDVEIATFLTLRSGSVFRAAAVALRVIAGNEVLIQKRIQTLELSTDGPSEARELRALADAYEKTADEQAAADDDLDDPGFEVIELVKTAQQARDRRWNDALRGL